MKKQLVFLILILFSRIVGASDFSIDNLFNLDRFHNVRLSPDGKHFIAVVDQYEKSKLVVFSLASMKPVKALTFQQSVKDTIYSVYWLNNDFFTYYIIKKSKRQANGYIPVGRFIASISQRKIRRENVGQVFHREEGRDDVFYDLTYKRGYAKVCRNRIKKKGTSISYRCVKKAKGRNPKLLMDRNNQLRVSYSDEEDKTRHFYYRDNDDADWVELGVYDRRKGKVYPVDLSKDGKKIMVLVSDGSSPNGFYWLDPKTKERELIHLMDKGKYGNIGKSIDYYLYDSDYPNPSVIGYQFSPEKPVSVYFDESSKEAKLQRTLESLFPEEVVTIVNYSSDATKALVITDSSKNPGSLYLMDIENNKLRFLFDLRPQINPKKMFDTEPFQITTRDGITLVGYLTFPHKEAKLNKSLPMLVKIHGGPYGVRDSWEFDADNQLIASKGYLVLQINYRGSSGYGTEFVFDAYKKMGAEMQDDITDATLWAIEQGYADRDRICIHGYSYGGYASLMGVVKEPDLYQCAIPSAGVYDIDLMHRFGDIQRHYTGERFLREAWGDSEEFFLERSPIHHLDKLKAALFITHGEKDERADFGQFEALTKKLKEIGYPFESLVLDKEGHSLADIENKKIFYRRFFNFLDKHIGPSAVKNK